MHPAFLSFEILLRVVLSLVAQMYMTYCDYIGSICIKDQESEGQVWTHVVFFQIFCIYFEDNECSSCTVIMESLKEAPQ